MIENNEILVDTSQVVKNISKFVKITRNASGMYFLIFSRIYGPIARKLYRGLFPKSIFQSTSTAHNELNIVSLYL